MPGRTDGERRKRPRAEDLIEAASADEDTGPAPLDGSEQDSEEGMPGDDPDDLESQAEEDESGSADEDAYNSASSASDDEEDDEEYAQLESTTDDQLKSVSFGTLAAAQAQLSRKRKRGSDAPEQDTSGDKLAALRARLQELKAAKSAGATTDKAAGKEDKRGADGQRSAHDASSDSDSGDSPEGDDSSDEEQQESGPARSRSSKHAPATQSTRYQVTRRRTVVDAPKRVARDPRFSAATRPMAPDRMARAYAFLSAYEDAEMAELSAAIKGTKGKGKKGKGRKKTPMLTEEELQARETLERKLMSMQNRRKANEAKEREREVVRKHRREEREAVAQGKKPYYLSEKEVKRRVLVERFEGMKKGERERAVERRRKKDSQREKRSMPAPRRVDG